MVILKVSWNKENKRLSSKSNMPFLRNEIFYDEVISRDDS